MNYQIFISYRRDGEDTTARLICEALKSKGYTVFCDYDALEGVRFDEMVHAAIDQCNDFILVLPPDSLVRWVNENDLVRQEITRALSGNKNIIPVMLNGFEFPGTLPDDIKDILRYNGVRFHMDNYETVVTKIIEKLSTRLPNSSHEIKELHGLAVKHSNFGDYSKAAELYEKCYNLRCKALGEEHADTLTTLHDLANAYFHLGNRQKAAELYEKCYNLRCKVLGEEHADTLTTLHNWADAHFHLGNRQKAAELFEKCYNLRCKALGEEHADTLTTLHNWANALFHLGNRQKAAELFEKCYNLRCKVLGEEHEDTLWALRNLAVTYNNLGDYSKAAELYEKCYNLRCKVLGEEHKDTLWALNNSAITYKKLGNYSKAAELYEKCYNLCRKMPDEAHPGTPTTPNDLASQNRKLGNRQKNAQVPKVTNVSIEHLEVKTRKDSAAQGKPKIYFTCHPDDFRFFDKIGDDILKLHDCAIYYTADMTAPIPEEYRAADLGQMNLFVTPITWRMLTKPNRAMDDDCAFAIKEHIPILPLMMETGIDEFYRKKFGNRQYLNPNSHDLTALGYEQKLSQYLSEVLFDSKTAERVRKAFDAYIFLSYRKKDRHHANELMSLIHKDPHFRDVAIWYDEFLTLGEDFDDNIQKALDKSDLFALLVTPNLVNEPNYVQTIEYPKARNAEKRILPAEMIKTDRQELESKYPGIPACIDAHAREALFEGVFDAFKDISLKPNDDDPEHNYLIGLAYLSGIDVEVNREYAIKLITSAAEANLPEAMDKLYRLYQTDGSKQALVWIKRLTEYYICTFGVNHPTTLYAYENLADTYYQFDHYDKAAELYEKCYNLRCKVLGEGHNDTLRALYGLANTYYELGDYTQARKSSEECYKLSMKFGQADQRALAALNAVASVHRDIGDFRKAVKLFKKCYTLSCKSLGKENPSTITVLLNLAMTYGDRLSLKTLKLSKKVYKIACKEIGEESPLAIYSLYIYSLHCFMHGCKRRGLELMRKAMDSAVKVLGEEHPSTIKISLAMAQNLLLTGSPEGWLMLEKCYITARAVFGEQHQFTRTALKFMLTYATLLDALDDEGQPNTVTALIRLSQKSWRFLLKFYSIFHGLILFILAKFGFISLQSARKHLDI